MAYQDLRAALAAFRERGRLLEVPGEVSPIHEAAAYLALAGRAPARAVVLRAAGHRTPIVGNLAFGREALAWGMGVEVDQVAAAVGRRTPGGVAPAPTGDAPVLEVTEAGVDLPALLPILTHYAGDSGPFITAGLASARDPDTGAVGRGIHRMELRGPGELGVALLNQPLSEIYAKHRERGVPMPFAVVLGLEPLTFLGCALKGSGFADKLCVAGALRGEAVGVVPGPLTGIPVPARAEFVLEGEVDPAAERPDGPLGEISGYSMAFPVVPTFRVKRVSHRASPLYQALLPTGPEGEVLLSVTAESQVLTHAEALYPFTRGFYFVPGTFGSSLVVRVARTRGEEVRNLLAHLLALPMVKKAVAVAEDVDPREPAEVEWSVATRCQPDRDALVLAGMRGQPIDPSAEGFRTSKLGLDATGYGGGGVPARATLAAPALDRAREWFSKGG
ncbi:MAG: UbiD family decarboxylase domain-containing protein [Deferrisomatales bacterium]